MFDRDPVCGKRVNRNKAHIEIEYGGDTHLLCCPACQSLFEQDPERYLRRRSRRQAARRADV